MQDLLKTVPQYIIPKHALSVFAGLVANNKQPWIKNFIIQRFIKKYQVNMDEALIENPCAYDSFNDFFTRYLKPECRPKEDAAIISPVDGCVSEIGSIEKGQLIQAKGKYYAVEELLATTADRAEKFSQGKFATLYLSPKDYHRVHMPIDATLMSMTYVPGALFSVQPSTAKTIPRLFSRNERLVLFFETSIGPMAMVLVGATIVGAIGTSWHGDIKRSKTRMSFDYNNLLLKQGDELGYFKLGSTVILLFANGNNMQWNSMLGATHPIRFGQALGALAEV